MSEILVYTNKDISKLNAWNGHDLRLIKLMEFSNDIKVTNDPSEVSKYNGCVVIDIPGLGIRGHLKICLRTKKLIRNVFLQDSPVRYSFSKLKHILKFRRFELITIKYILNFFRLIIREFYFYFICSKIGFVSDVDALIKSKCIVSKNGVNDYSPLLVGESERLVFWGNLNYEPNLESIISYVERNHSFFLNHKLHLFGRLSIETKARLLNLNKKDELVIIHGEYNELEDVIFENDIFFNCVDFGSGIKNKTIESIRLGVRQLATNHATAGIKIKHSSIIKIELNDDFEKKLIDVKSMPILVDGKDLYENKLSWNEAVKSYLNFVG